MILVPEEVKTIIESLVYMLKSAYTEEEIMSSCEHRPEVYKSILARRKDRLNILRRLICRFRGGS